MYLKTVIQILVIFWIFQSLPSIYFIYWDTRCVDFENLKIEYPNLANLTDQDIIKALQTEPEYKNICVNDLLNYVTFANVKPKDLVYIHMC